MNTITAPPPARLRDLVAAPHPRLGTRLRDLIDTEQEPSLRWRANHTEDDLPVTGGAEQVRLLVHAIDGDSWPFTGVEDPASGRWFQVLGTTGACLLELSDASLLSMVSRRGHSADDRVSLPAECQFWVASAFSSELHTAADAFHLGMRHLRGYDLPYGFELRPVYEQTGARNL